MSQKDEMINGIFYAKFDTREGIKVIHQSPPGCIVPEPDVDKPRLFNFDDIAEYIIPKQAFCNRYVTINSPDNKYRILGHPVCIKNSKYYRNEFMFNFCIVIETDVDEIPYEAVVRRLASTFTEMETQNQFLSQEDLSNDRDRRSIESLLEIIKEDLNNYQECMIPVDDANTINMKLFPHHPAPAPIKPWHVPITKIFFEPIIDDTWDLTMKRIIPFINGITDVRRIALLADVALDLAIIALRHLLYYDSIIILDLFLFSNIYACTPEINAFVADTDGMQNECADYVFINGHRLPHFWLVRLYTSLSTSRTLKEWIKVHLENGLPVLDVLDVRRLIQFGVIKGFLYRVHKYVVSAKYLKSLVTGQNLVIEGAQEYLKYVDGMSAFDRIYLEQEVDDKMVMEKLRNFPKGDLEVFYR